MSSRRARVVFVIWTMAIGGAERQLAALVNGLDPERYEAWVVCIGEPGPMADRFAFARDRLTSLGFTSGKDPRIAGALRRAIRAIGDVDIVHATNFSATAWGRLAGGMEKVPVLVTAEHTTRRLTAAEGTFVRLANLILSRKTSAVVACAESQVATLLAERDPAERIVVIRNGIDPEVLRPEDADPASLRARVGTPAEAAVVSIIARLEPEKNHRMFLDAAARIAAADGGAEFWLVGDGEMRSELEEYAARLGLGDRVRFLGMVRDMASVLAASDVVCLTSRPRVETFPMCLLEAMAFGKPVVGTDVGGVAEMVEDGVNGYVVAEGDTEAMTRRLSELLSDAGLRERMGVAGRAIVHERFTSSRMVREYEDLFSRLLAASEATSARE